MLEISIAKRLAFQQGFKNLEIKCAVADRSWVTIFGPSGSGKTSLLKMIAGLIQPDSGTISWNKNQWFDEKLKIVFPIQKRNIGFVFQDFALFPNMSVEDNLYYAQGRNKDSDLVRRLLDVSDLSALAEQKPSKLSGGQQQRLAIIRALAKKPDLLLLDEPFSSLDIDNRNKIRVLLIRMQQELNFTILLVSHDSKDLFGTHIKQWIRLENGEAIFFNKANDALKSLGHNIKTGKVLKKAKIEDFCLLEIKVIDEHLKIPVSNQLFTTINVEDEVILDLIDNQLRIVNI